MRLGLGSSPLARGLPSQISQTQQRAGIIPARAGFTRSCSGASGVRADHPRSRGVYVQATLGNVLARGSSPLARGLPRTRQVRRRPAGDHPRSRGVYGDEARPGGGVRGSSPLARGLLRERTRTHATEGIIPARAGFTLIRVPGRVTCTDHPRSRGVYKVRTRRSRRPAGSSPLARGLRPRVAEEVAAITDHPRSRGVYSTLLLGVDHLNGSSPLARGLL